MRNAEKPMHEVETTVELLEEDIDGIDAKIL